MKRLQLQSSISNMLSDELRLLRDIFSKNDFTIRLVGGVVRDMVLGVPNKDIDLATDATPDEMISMFDNNGIHYIPTGLSHGTLTAVINHNVFEITTLRIDANHTGRHADVSFTTSWEEDASRRDLTFNAMSLDLDGTLYDYFNGVRDLEKGVARFVGDPRQRIQEDYLRILRWYRFLTRVKQPLYDPETSQAIKDNAKGLETISGERIWSEFAKIIIGDHADKILAHMHNSSVGSFIGIALDDLDAFSYMRQHTRNVYCLLTSLLPNMEALNSIRERWKLDNNTYNSCKWLIENRNHNITVENAKYLAINGANKEWLSLLFQYNDDHESAREIENWTMPKFPVSGNDLVSYIDPGPEMGIALRDMRDKWFESNFTATKEDLVHSYFNKSSLRI